MSGHKRKRARGDSQGHERHARARRMHGGTDHGDGGETTTTTTTSSSSSSSSSGSTSASIEPQEQEPTQTTESLDPNSGDEEPSIVTEVEAEQGLESPVTIIPGSEQSFESTSLQSPKSIGARHERVKITKNLPKLPFRVQIANFDEPLHRVDTVAQKAWEALMNEIMDQGPKSKLLMKHAIPQVSYVDDPNDGQRVKYSLEFTSELINLEKMLISAVRPWNLFQKLRKTALNVHLEQVLMVFQLKQTKVTIESWVALARKWPFNFDASTNLFNTMFVDQLLKWYENLVQEGVWATLESENQEAAEEFFNRFARVYELDAKLVTEVPVETIREIARNSATETRTSSISFGGLPLKLMSYFYQEVAGYPLLLTDYNLLNQTLNVWWRATINNQDESEIRRTGDTFQQLATNIYTKMFDMRYGRGYSLTERQQLATVVKQHLTWSLYWLAMFIKQTNDLTINYQEALQSEVQPSVLLTILSNEHLLQSDHFYLNSIKALSLATLAKPLAPNTKQ